MGKFTGLIIAMSVIFITFGFGMAGFTLYDGITSSSETVYDVSIDEESVVVMSEDDEITEDDYDIKIDSLSSKSKEIYTQVEENTGVTKEYDGVRYENKPPQQILNEPIICDDCGIIADLEDNGEYTEGITGTYGLYQITVEETEIENGINYNKVIIWSSIGFINLIIISAFVIRRLR